MELSENINNVTKSSLNHYGYEIIRIEITGGKRMIVRIDIDRFDGNCVSIDDCVKANQIISTILDVEDFIRMSYTLEISSPGEYRAFTKIDDFQRFCGRSVKVELFNTINERRKFLGRLLKVEQNSNDTIVYFGKECDIDIIEFIVPYNNIKKISVKRF